MKITVIGTGYVGLVSGACLAYLGNRVLCVDNNREKINLLKSGEIPIYEPDLDKIVAKSYQSGNLRFSDDFDNSVNDADIIMLAVGTPSDDKTGKADLTYIKQASLQIAKVVNHDVIIVVKSTVPVGTCEQLKKIFKSKKPKINFEVVSNPEFLREGSAVNDFLKPDRIIIGAESDHAKEAMNKIYGKLIDSDYPVLFTNLPTAELIKYASNAFLATKTAFVNEMADICEGYNADIEVVARGMGMDNRIGTKHMRAGPGFGGSCFPKDTTALLHIAKQVKAPTSIVESVVVSNNKRKLKMVKKIQTNLKGKLRNKQIAILGLTFKANTDDVRYSPALVIVNELIKKSAKLKLYDPAGMNEAKKNIKRKVNWSHSIYDCVKNADAVVIITEWEEFTNMDLSKVRNLMNGNLIVDLRNILNADEVAKHGLKYVGVGRYS